MKVLFVEDDGEMCAVCYVTQRGVPMFSDSYCELSEADISRCVKWCVRTGSDYSIREV